MLHTVQKTPGGLGIINPVHADDGIYSSSQMLLNLVKSRAWVGLTQVSTLIQMHYILLGTSLVLSI